MSIIIPPGYAQASFIHVSPEGTEPFVCTLGLNLGDAGGDYVRAADSAFDAWMLNILPIMDSDLALDRVTLLIGANGPSGSVDSTHIATPGSRTGEGLPWALSAIARKQTTDLGRSGRGRMFIPGLVAPSEIGQGGTISSTRRATIQGRLDDFHEALTDPEAFTTLPPVLFHSAAVGLASPTAITSFTLAPLVGWIRKRIR